MMKQNTILRILQIVFGSGLAVIGCLGILFGILAVFDPVGAQLSNDADPLGTPPTTLESLLKTLIFFFVFAVGVSLIVGVQRLKQKYSGGLTTK